MYSTGRVSAMLIKFEGSFPSARSDVLSGDSRIYWYGNRTCIPYHPLSIPVKLVYRYKPPALVFTRMQVEKYLRRFRSLSLVAFLVIRVTSVERY